MPSCGEDRCNRTFAINPFMQNYDKLRIRAQILDTKKNFAINLLFGAPIFNEHSFNII